MVFLVGYLHTATSRIAPVTYFEVESGESGIEVDFVNEDDLPLPCVHSESNFIEHPESDEVGSDFLSDLSGSEGDEEGESKDDEELETVKSI